MARVNVVERRLERFLREPTSVRNAAGVIVLVTVLVVVAAGFLITVLDREEYPSLSVGLWWALQTVTTVGYGDVTPTNVSGRLVAAAVMLEGIAFIAIVTAAITSTFVARASRQAEAARLQDEVSDRELMERRFDELERKLDLLASGPGNQGCVIAPRASVSPGPATARETAPGRRSAPRSPGSPASARSRRTRG